MQLNDWERVVLRACCTTLEDTIALGRRIPNATAAGVRLMLAGFTSVEIELFKVFAALARADIIVTATPTGEPHHDTRDRCRPSR